MDWLCVTTAAWTKTVFRYCNFPDRFQTDWKNFAGPGMRLPGLL
jgi:hypothetical protein